MKGEREKARQDAEKALSLGIPVNQGFIESVKKGETKGKGGAPQAQGPTSGKFEPPAEGETRKK